MSCHFGRRVENSWRDGVLRDASQGAGGAECNSYIPKCGIFFKRRPFRDRFGAASPPQVAVPSSWHNGCSLTANESDAT